MTPASPEATILERVRQSLEAEGFNVIIEPNGLALPAFLAGFRPDAIAYGKGKNLVIEVTTQTPAAEKRMHALRAKVAPEPGWELRLVWTSVGSATRSLHRTPSPIIQSTLEDVDKLVEAGQYKAAFLMGWSSLEAAGRGLLPDVFAKPQTPLRLVEQLASNGALTPSEADDLRDLVSKRNRLIHGELRADIKRKDVTLVVDVVRKLADDMPLAA